MALCTLPQEDNPNDQELVDEVGAAREALALIQSNLAAPSFHACPGSSIEVCLVLYCALWSTAYQRQLHLRMHCCQLMAPSKMDPNPGSHQI